MVSRLELTKASNGGWIVTEPGERPGYIPQAMAAFSTTEDMLNGLREITLDREQAAQGQAVVDRVNLKPGAIRYVEND